MGLAFWRSKKRADKAAARPANRSTAFSDDDPDSRPDAAAALRTRARHRLIGAAALLLAVAVVVPMLLDPEPRAIPDNIPIDIPSERTPFTPRLSLPPVPAPDNAPLAPPPDQPPASAEAVTDSKPAAAAADGKSDAAKAGKSKRESSKTQAAKTDALKPEAAKAETKAAVDAKGARLEEERARAALEGRLDVANVAATTPAPAKGGKFAVQAAAPASEKSARELGEQLKKGGFASFVEKVDTRDGARYRVRVGPYATRDEAEQVRARLKSQGVAGNVVAL